MALSTIALFCSGGVVVMSFSMRKKSAPLAFATWVASARRHQIEDRAEIMRLLPYKNDLRG